LLRHCPAVKGETMKIVVNIALSAQQETTTSSIMP